MAFLPENLPPVNNDPNESSEDEQDNPHRLRKEYMNYHNKGYSRFFKLRFRNV